VVAPNRIPYKSPFKTQNQVGKTHSFTKKQKGKSRGKCHGFLLEGYYVDLSATASARTASRTSAAAAAKQGNGNRQNAAAVAYDAFYQSRTAAVAATKENED
jgi:hypothetical protein